MKLRRFEVIALCAMLFAALAFFVSLQSNARASSASACFGCPIGRRHTFHIQLSGFFA